MIKELDIIGGIIESIKNGDLTEEELLLYLENNKTILRSNIEQAFIKYKKEKLNEIVRDIFNKYLVNEALILSNDGRFSAVRDQVIDSIDDEKQNDPTQCTQPVFILVVMHDVITELIETKRYFCSAHLLRSEYFPKPITNDSSFLSISGRS